MKRRIRFPIVLLILVVCQAAFLWALQDPFSLTIGLNEQTVKCGSPITVTTRLTNTSKQVLTFFFSRPECEYQLYAFDSDGKPVLDTQHKRELNCTGGFESGRNILVVLKPNESRPGDNLRVSDLCDMTRPGKYTIQLAREIPKDAGSGFVRSNVITVTVPE